MKISIITVVFNNREFLAEAIESVRSQTYDNIEYIVVDGGSTDGSVDIIKENSDFINKWISEPDSGIYDAMNKGLRFAKGEIIGFLNSDDLYNSKKIVEKIVSIFKEKKIDALYGDLVYLSRDLTKKIRYWKAGNYKSGIFSKGWMPPHPTFFAKKNVYDRFGNFNCNFEISADYEIMLRFIVKNHISIYYLPEIIVKMRVGGVSNRGLLNLFKKSLEDFRAWRVNGIKMGILIVFKKPFRKISQLF